jgi:hypothetical protein
MCCLKLHAYTPVTPSLGECVESLGRRIAWMSPVVDLGRFGCSRGGGLTIFLNI